MTATVDNGTITPPFPENVITHPLLVVDFAKLKNGDKYEQDMLWEACTTLGFFYLKNHGVDTQPMWELGEATMALPLEEKLPFEQGNSGNSFGYKAIGTANTDEHGSLDATELINVAKDDALAWPRVVHRNYPSTVDDRMSAVRKFVESSESVTRTILDILSDRLELPRDLLVEKHNSIEKSLSESRVSRSPPRPEGMSEEQAYFAAHTDFGSLNLLHNILGGLQVLAPETNSWQYAKPLPGHAICNIGDTLAIYSGGVLRSNPHRVVSPPGAQGKCTRWSLSYFLRPATFATLEPLTQSPAVAAAARKHNITIGDNVTAGAWSIRRVRNMKAANRKGPETWRASRGTEFISNAT